MSQCFRKQLIDSICSFLFEWWINCINKISCQKKWMHLNYFMPFFSLFTLYLFYIHHLYTLMEMWNVMTDTRNRLARLATELEKEKRKKCKKRIYIAKSLFRWTEKKNIFIRQNKYDMLIVFFIAFYKKQRFF